MHAQSSTLDQIAVLEQTRQALLADTDSELATFHNAARLQRLHNIKVELDQLWVIERQYRASQRCQNSNQSPISARR